MLTRARPLLGVLLLAVLTTVAHAQVPTIEDIAGAIPVANRPGLEVPMVPSKIARGADGQIYMVDWGRSRVTQFNPVNGTLTTLNFLTKGNSKSCSACWFS